MGLNGIFNIGGTALAVNTAAIQTTGNNIANVGNPEYVRQRANLGSTVDTKISAGQFVGNGVRLDGISRQIDDALEARLRGSLSDGASASTRQDWLGRLEATFNELTDSDLSTSLSTFFKGWSDLANKPQDSGLRQVVLQNAANVTDWFHQIDSSLSSLQETMNDQVKGMAGTADDLAQQIAKLNVRITAAEGGNAGASANGLRDQRDGLIKELSGLMDITTVETKGGAVNIYVNSEPLVFNADCRGVTTVQTEVNGHTFLQPAFKANNGVIKISSGQLGALAKAGDRLRATADHVDELAGSLSFELNKLHTAGQGLKGLTSTIGQSIVTDTTVPLNDPDSGLKQLPNNGSFVVHVKNTTTGLTTSTLVKVDLNGTPADTTMDDLIAQINAVDGVTAVNNGGRLQMSSDDAPTSEITFSQDSSGVLASLGVNTFFSGSKARDINVSDALVKDPTLIAAAKNGDSGDNQTALSIAKLETTAVSSLAGATMKDSYAGMIDNIAAETSQAATDVESTAAVTETLTNQRESVSGVSMDEEAVNLMKYQRAYQGAARLITVVDELMDTMLNMVR